MFLLQDATFVAESMVKEWGMSEKIGLRALDKEMSQPMTELVDQEIQRLLQESYERAKKICREHQFELRFLADTLMKCGGTLSADQINIVLVRAKMKGTHY